MSTAAASSGFSLGVTGTATSGYVWVSEEVLWLVIVGFIAAFLLAFAVGANDVANSFGTAVGAKVLTLRQACILATIFETSGAVLLGAKVGEMIRKGIIDVNVYDRENGARLLMLGEVSAMFGSGIWQLVATCLKLPVSGTHSIVGACIGFSLVAVGSTGVRWSNLGVIVASWFISPVLSGITAVILYYAVQKFILKSLNGKVSYAESTGSWFLDALCCWHDVSTRTFPLKNGLIMLPFFYAVTVGMNVFSILYSGAPLLGLKYLPTWGAILIAIGFMILVGVAIQFYLVPKLQKEEGIERSDETSLSKYVNEKGSSNNDPSEVKILAPEASQHKSDATRVQVEEKKDDGHFKPSEYDDSTSLANSVSNCYEEPSFPVKLMTSDTSIEKCGFAEAVPKKKKRKFWQTDKKEISESEETIITEDEDPKVITRLFSSLQVLTACFASFAHGGNDVSNAIGPLIALWIIFGSGDVTQKEFTPWYLLLYGGLTISVGLWILGKRVIETIGQDLTKLTPSRGFCIELMSAFTVLVASNLGIPISTTHCKVGAVVSIGWYRSRSAVQWSVVRNIAFAWCVTLPIAGLLSALTMFILMQI